MLIEQPIIFPVYFFHPDMAVFSSKSGQTVDIFSSWIFFWCHFSESMENWKTTLEMCVVNSCKKWSRNWWLFLWKKAGVVRGSFLVPFQRESLQNPLKHMGSSIGPIGWTYMYVCASGFTCRGRGPSINYVEKQGGDTGTWTLIHINIFGLGYNLQRVGFTLWGLQKMVSEPWPQQGLSLIS